MKKKRKTPLLLNIFKKIKYSDNKIVVYAFCLFKFVYTKDTNFDTRKLKLIINNEKYEIKLLFKRGIPFIKRFFFNFYKFELPIDSVKNFDIHNKIILNYDNNYNGRIIYNIFDLKKGKSRNSKIIVKDNTSIYLRQTIKNTMYITVREKNNFDNFKGQLKLNLSYFISKIYPKKDIILMYEKESSRYEESASVLYEKLIDLGYDNCYFIINKDNKKIDHINKKYKKNLIYKHSFKHLIYFFKTKKFIGTEMLGHAIELRVANKYAVRKTSSKDLSFVFLQHGVMYMISLDADNRTGFRNNNIKLYRTVVSSHLEAQHFIELGGFNEDELYVTGLAKFDKSIKNKNSDKIVIMPTWRIWESNKARDNFQQTKYYKMINRIVKSIPNDLLSKVIILPHPLMLEAMKKSNCRLKKYLPNEIEYNEILKECKVLITDYSSVSYDAFYRGSNIIFYWEEKDDCLKHYGQSAKLMLNDKLAFGDICFKETDLKNVIETNYYNNQSKKYQRRYKKIVEFNDNENTTRIVNMLIKDKLIGGLK